jgi:hypothetical protein
MTKEFKKNIFKKHFKGGSDITKNFKSGGGLIDSAKGVGKYIGNSAKKTGKSIGESASSAYKGAKSGMETTGKIIETTGKILSNPKKIIENAGESIAKGVDYASKLSLEKSIDNVQGLQQQFKDSAPTIYKYTGKAIGLTKSILSRMDYIILVVLISIFIIATIVYNVKKNNKLYKNGFVKFISIIFLILSIAFIYFRFVPMLPYFFKSDFYFFIKYYFYFLILFSICFYILMYLNNSKNPTSRSESKVFFYLLLIFLFIIISEILSTPQESLDKFIMIIIFSLILVYIISKIINHYRPSNFGKNFWSIFGISLFIFSVVSGIIYYIFEFKSKDKNKASNLYSTFNYAIIKNLNFLIFFTIYLFFFKSTYSFFDSNTNLATILQPAILGILLMFFIFCVIIYIALKSKLINKNQVLNTFLALFSISIFLGLMLLQTFMSSLSTICATKEEDKSSDNTENICLLIIISIIIVLWYDDERNWHQIGSILFVIITIFALYVMFSYSTTHPSCGLLSFWLFIEWCILVSYRKLNSKNSLHFSFMNT